MKNKLVINTVLYICVVFLFFVPVHQSISPDFMLLDTEASCERLLMKYAENTSNFTKCFIQYARPIKVCEKCSKNFKAVNESHSNITHLDKAGEKCKEELVNMDRLQVIEYSYEYVKDQWRKAACEKCLDKNLNLNAKSFQLLKENEKVELCFDNSKDNHSSDQKIVCKKCHEKYSKLNTNYEKYGAANNFCMDIIDMVNITRQKWSVELGCSSECNKPAILFGILIFTFLTSPVIFYVSVWYGATTNNRPMTYQERWTSRFDRLQVNSTQ